MAEQNENENNLQSSPPMREPGAELDAGGKSLSEALRVSFIILKFIMVALVIFFLASGIETVGPSERAMVLRFGKIQGIGEKRLLAPGLHWIFPYPIDEIVKIPVEKKVNLPINLFWYYEDPDEALYQGAKAKRRPPAKLNPIREGYCITRNQKQNLAAAGLIQSDYNIVHSKWQLTYQINDPERFFRNVYVEDVKPGDIYFDVIKRTVTEFLENLAADAIVDAMVNYTIDEALASRERIPKHVTQLLGEKLNAIESGIKAVSVQLTDVSWPRQVDAAFQDSIKARQTSKTAITEARTYAENVLNEAAGPVAGQLHKVLGDANADVRQKEFLWSQVAGQAGEKIALARAYRTSVVENASANARYLQEILPEYKKRPELVIQTIYQDAIEYIFDNADEKMIIQPTEGVKGKEIWIQLNRDPKLKPKS